jgi:hypothetical protein
MWKWVLIGLFASVALTTAGCATVARSPEENLYNTRSIVELDMREMADDWNLMWLADRQCRLTRWHTR